jgi:prepilin-type N-terminal cleavage/methylation domain-containing protein
MSDRGHFALKNDRRALKLGTTNMPFRASRAFTMIELIVVVVIVAIITTAGLYSYATFRNSHVQDVSSGLVEQVLLQARNRAITLNRIQEIQVDLDRNLIWVDQFNPPEAPAVLLVRVPYVVPEVGMADFVDLVSIRVDGNPAQTTGIVPVRLEPGAPGPLVLIELRREPDDATLDESYTTIRMEPGSLDVEVLKRTRIP